MKLAARQEMQDPAPEKFDVFRASANLGADNWASLRKAAENKDTDAALGIIEAGGMGVNAQDPTGKTPLMIAVEHGNHAMVEALVSRGATVDIQDDDGRTAFDFAMPGATTTGERDAMAEGPRASCMSAEILTAMTQGLYAVARNRPTDQTPCQFLAEYLREFNASKHPPLGMKLPHADLVDYGDNTVKPLGVSSNELNIALEFFSKFDVDQTGTLEIEEVVLLVMRIAERIAGQRVPDQTILRAAKTLLSDAAKTGDGMIHRAELASGLDRICPVFRSFRSQFTGMKPLGVDSSEQKDVNRVVDELYADYDLNSDGILMPDEIALLTRRVADASGMEISDTQVMELFRLMMNHSMQDKDDDGVLSKDEVKSALNLVMDFFRETLIKKYGSASDGTILTVKRHQ